MGLRVAIIRLSSLGDVIIATSVLGVLRECEVEWFVDERFSGVLKHSMRISKIHALPFKRLLKSPKGILQIRKYCRECGEFDAVVDMQSLIKSAFIGSFIHTKRYIGFSFRGCREGLASLFYSYKVVLPYDENILKRNLSLFEPLGVECERILPDSRLRNIGFDEIKIQPSVKATMQIQNQCKFLFVLEASITQKEYPVEKFAVLAQLISHKIQNFCVFVIWNKNETKADELCERLGKLNIFYQKMPQLDLNELKFCIAHMDCVIGGDTGVTHLAWAMGRECITLYGNALSTSGKNMSSTKLERVLLGNPYLVSQSGEFEISSIDENDIFKVFVENILPKLTYKAQN